MTMNDYCCAADVDVFVCGPGVMRVTSRDVLRSVDRGVGGPGIEPRNEIRDADAFCAVEAVRSVR
jgi:hypothetical protein